MASQTLDTQVERRRLEVRENGFVDEIRVGDILVHKSGAVLVTCRGESYISTLGRKTGSTEGVYLAKRELIDGRQLLPIPFNEELYFKNDGDSFYRRCYETGDQMLREAGL